MDEDRLAKRKQKAKRDGNVVQLAQVSKELGDMYFETGRLKDALLEYNDQLAACEVLNEKLDCAVAHRMIGEVRASLGEYEEALIHQTLHLEGAREAESLLEQQRALATIGRTHFCRAQALPEGSPERTEACAAAKKAYSKSLRLCNDLDNTSIELAEMMTMRARLLLNLGLVLEEQKELCEAIELIEKAAELFKKHRVVDDLHRTRIALAALHERLGHFGLALRHVDEAIEIDDPSLKAVGRLTKAELLLRLGHWSEARRILVFLYLSEDVTGTTSQQVQKLLRIVVTICRAEESLEVENEMGTRRRLYETLGDAATFVRSYEKALEYYSSMLSCAEKESSKEQISAALVSIVQTLRDLSRYDEALPHARRELSMCIESTEICRSALNLADLLYLTHAPKSEIMTMYELARTNARESNDSRLEASVLNDTMIYLNEIREFVESQELREKFDLLGGEDLIDTAISENESESGNIGDDICLEDLSDVEAEMRKKDETAARRNSRRTGKRSTGSIVRRNAKGETRLHVACIAGNIEEVARLLESKHPTDVRDYCGWTPLHEAANHGHVEIAELLIKSGANVDDPGGPMCGGVTPLHDAASCGHFSVMRLLMKNRADLLAKTRDGDTILDCLEAWRSRTEFFTDSEKIDYNELRAMLASLLPKSTKNIYPNVRKNDFYDLTDVNDADDAARSANERISAGEDYRRTIENLKNRCRPSETRATMRTKIAPPLVDSEEAMVDDWLEDDLDATLRENSVDEASSTGKKRKTNGSIEKREIENSCKRPRFVTGENFDDNVAIRDNDCSSDSSDGILFSRKSIRAGKKRTRQLSLFKTGFTRDRPVSRDPSPLFNRENVSCNNFGTIGAPVAAYTSETIKLEIRIDEKMLNFRLRFPEQRGTSVESLMRDVTEKFENETGCRIRVNLATMSGEILLSNDTLENFRPVDGFLRLSADIVENEIPMMVDRYGKICENLQIPIRDTVLKCLKICENTSTFRARSARLVENETAPLLRCLEYQEKLQILEMSGESLHETGELLGNVLKRLTNLQELHLQGCDIDETCLRGVVRLPPKLRIIDLSYNPLGPGSEKFLRDLIANNRHLQTLNLRFCKLTRFATSDDWSSLANLDLSWNSLVIDETKFFLPRQMLSLDLSCTRDNRESSSSISREILGNSSFTLRTLECLDLSCCDLTDRDVDDVIARSLNLSKIVLGGNKKLTQRSVEALLVRKPTLVHIDAAGCQKIVDIPGDYIFIDDPRNCTLRVSMSSSLTKYWLKLWRDRANTMILPHDIITFVPIVR